MVQRKPAVAVVDDDPGVLRSVVRLLALHGFEARPFSSSDALLNEIDTLEPSCVVVDLYMPGLTGLELQRSLAAHSSSYPIVFITGHGDVRTSVQAMRDGAVDFLTKPFQRQELIEAVERAVARSRMAREQSDQLTALRARIASLTPREREVFKQVVAGYLNKQIAANLGISEKTVKVHRARVMRKMSARAVVHLGRMAEQMGNVGP